MDGYVIERTPYFDVGECNLECFYCGGRGWYKENRGSRTTPHFGQLCCSQGKIYLESFPKLPDGLNILFTESPSPVNSTNSVQNYFLKHIRLFNAGLVMASLQLNDSSLLSKGPCAMKIHGQVYHRGGPMLANEERTPTCLQTYFFDPEEQAKLRANMMMSTKDTVKEYTLKVHIFQRLYDIIQNCSNSYLNDFLTINEYINKNNLNP